VPLNQAATDVLERRQDDHPTDVFTYEGNNPIVQVNTKASRNTLQRAGIQDFRWHDLRHTFATWHREAGTPTHELQRLGGWKTQSMVERYAQVAPEGLQFAASRLDSFLQPRSNFQ
jgi:integrase